MTEQDYLLAWTLYALAALGCLLVGFRITAWMWRALREPLRVLMAVLLCTPTLVDPARELQAPAIAIAALDLLFKTGLVSAVITILAISWGIYRRDMQTLAWALVVSFHVNFFIAYYVMYTRIFGKNLFRYFARMMPAALVIVGMVLWHDFS